MWLKLETGRSGADEISVLSGSGPGLLRVGSRFSAEGITERDDSQGKQETMLFWLRDDGLSCCSRPSRGFRFLCDDTTRPSVAALNQIRGGLDMLRARRLAEVPKSSVSQQLPERHKARPMAALSSALDPCSLRLRDAVETLWSSLNNSRRPSSSRHSVLLHAKHQPSNSQHPATNTRFSLHSWSLVGPPLAVLAGASYITILFP